MKLFDVYPLQDITPHSAKGSYITDEKGEQYLDFYGGHAVISIGHSHPHYISSLKKQLDKIGFYSNSVQMPLQHELAKLLGEVSGLNDFQLFLVNSGAEANENALKVASMVTGRKKVIAFKGAFHGRTSGVVAATDNPKIVAPYNELHEVVFVPFNDIAAFKSVMNNEVAAVIIECIQGVAGIKVADSEFLKALSVECKQYGALLIADEVQCGYGRTGKFFAFQYSDIKPDIITTAKGMGNGFPIGSVLISPDIAGWHGMLGTTFGGNYLACAAAIAVLEVIKNENLIQQAEMLGKYLMEELQQIDYLKNIRGKGLMIGFDVDEEHKNLRNILLSQHHIMTGNAGTHTIRLLPSLAVNKQEIDQLISALKSFVDP